METRNSAPFSVQTTPEERLSCPQCGEETVTTTICPHVFTVGSERKLSNSKSICRLNTVPAVISDF